MTWWHHLLRPAAQVAGFHAAIQLRQFVDAHQKCRQVQDALLRRLILHHADTDFGRQHGFSAIRNYDDFRNAVPLGDYDSLRPYLKNVYEGRLQALFPAGSKVLMYALTSGTTGEPKRIPVTRESLASYKRGWTIFGYKALRDHRELWLRKILQVSSPAVEDISPTGLPCGAISGMLAQTQKRIVRRMYVVPPEVMAMNDPDAKYYTIMRLAMPHDIGLLTTANPSTVIQLMTVVRQNLEAMLRDLRDGTLKPPGEISPELVKALPLRKHPQLVRRIQAGLDRDGELLFKHFWNLSLLMHWTGGTLGLYLPEVRRLTGNVPIRDIGLLASEGRFSVPLQDETAAGVADITSSFLEFIPAEEIDSRPPPVLRAHELTLGGEYFLVLSNFSGLWRYNIQDRVRVTGFLGGSPVFAFLSKGAHTANLTGEKLTEHQVVQAVREAAEQRNLSLSRFVMQPCFALPPFYRLRVECPDATPDFAEAVDRSLQAINIEYASKRHSGRLGAIRLEVATKEQFDQREAEILQKRRGRTEQYKHQYLMTDIVQ